MATWTRRQVLAQMGIAAAAVHTLDPHELCCAVPAHAQTATKDLFELKKVADGVYIAVAATTYKINSNAAVIMTDDGVIVVDSHSKPSAARAVYTQIQKVTNKPVRKIVNTHFHWDHWQGNDLYRAANPGLEIIATERTKENLTKADAGRGGIPFVEQQLKTLPAEIEKLKADILKEANADTKKNLESNLQQAESYQQELKQFKPALPTRTVSTTATLREQGREIQLQVLGRGHTDGDLYIYLPKEKVVMTGDALVDSAAKLTLPENADLTVVTCALNVAEAAAARAGVAVVVIDPNLTQRVARVLGVGRGVDAVFYLTIVLLFYLVFRVHKRMRGLERQITELVRKLAIMSAK